MPSRKSEEVDVAALQAEVVALRKEVAALKREVARKAASAGADPRVDKILKALAASPKLMRAYEG